MRTLALAVAATSLAVPAATVLPAANADAALQRHHHKHHKKIKHWRGRDGRWHCKKPDGTTGLLIGGVAGALVGRTVDTEGDRTAGTVIGGVAGALAGREIDRGDARCE